MANESPTNISKTSSSASSGSVRPSVRPELRDDPVARAKARARQIRENLGDNGLDDGDDRFRINPHEIPEGWTYEWKRKYVLGQADPSYEVELVRKGWEPVPLSRHPHMMPAGMKMETIERDGMILMERPKELTDEARDVELRRAKSQVRQKEQQLAATPDGTMTRDHPQARPNVRKGYEPMPIPES
jgi:hypothetical protein